MIKDAEKIRAYRLHAHHLDEKVPPSGLWEAAGACGLQNSPPGAWETALFNRAYGCSLLELQDILYKEKSLLQAWSFRGAPVVFPTSESDVFLTALMAREGEQPWIYTSGIAAALDFLGMSFEQVYDLMRKAVGYLDCHTVKSKETLDQVLAGIVWKELPAEKQVLWNAPSMYGRPDRQTVGGAAVSFLLRPCSFDSLVVFGERQGISPVFTSFRNWTGLVPEKRESAEKELVRKFLHCYGPATVNHFGEWLGCSPAQARRLWSTIEEEMVRLNVMGRVCYMLACDAGELEHSELTGERLLLLGAHDPYLDMKDKTVILEDPGLQKAVWRYAANPGVILKGGRGAGIWKARAQNGKLYISMTLFEQFSGEEQKVLKNLAAEYGAFRKLVLKECTIEA